MIISRVRQSSALNATGACSPLGLPEEQSDRTVSRYTAYPMLTQNLPTSAAPLYPDANLIIDLKGLKLSVQPNNGDKTRSIFNEANRKNRNQVDSVWAKTVALL